MFKSDEREITRPGHTVTYTLTVENTGDQDLQDVIIEDPIPSWLTVTSINNGGRLSDDKKSVIWSGIVLEEGEKKTVSFTVKVAENAPKNTQICNRVTARSADHGLDDSAEDCVKVEVVPKVAAVKEVKVVAVPVTAKTGAGVALSSLSTLAGMAGLVLSVKRAK